MKEMKAISLDTQVTVKLNSKGKEIFEKAKNDYCFFNEEHPFPQSSENGTVTMSLRDLMFIFGGNIIGNGIQCVPDPFEEMYIEA